MSSASELRRTYPEDAHIGMIEAADGWPLRVFDWPAPETGARGSILFQTGRGDCFEKYIEAFRQWHAQGWGITAFDWRGQGYSGRTTKNKRVGHIDDFSIWVNDLADFYAHWAAVTPGPHIVMGHSMGGHLVLRALVEKRIAPDGAVLIAPMLGFDAPGIARPLVKMLAAIVPDHIPAWPGNEKPGLFASRQGYLTHDDDRFADEVWWRQQKPEIVLGPPSYQWLNAAFRSYDVIEVDGGLEAVTTPMTILGTAGDQLVSPKAIRRVAARLLNAHLTMFNKSVAHEILRESNGPRGSALAAIDDLLQRVTPAA
jgi:lysophospholipase